MYTTISFLSFSLIHCCLLYSLSLNINGNICFLRTKYVIFSFKLENLYHIYLNISIIIVIVSPFFPYELLTYLILVMERFISHLQSNTRFNLSWNLEFLSHLQLKSLLRHKANKFETRIIFKISNHIRMSWGGYKVNKQVRWPVSWTTLPPRVSVSESEFIKSRIQIRIQMWMRFGFGVDEFADPDLKK